MIVLPPAPPGPIGVIFVTADAGFAVAAEVKENSSLRGKLCPGDRVLAVDGEDTASLSHDKLVAYLTERKDQERMLVVAC